MRTNLLNKYLDQIEHWIFLQKVAFDHNHNVTVYSSAEFAPQQPSDSFLRIHSALSKEAPSVGTDFLTDTDSEGMHGAIVDSANGVEEKENKQN